MTEEFEDLPPRDYRCPKCGKLLWNNKTVARVQDPPWTEPRWLHLACVELPKHLPL